jgi:hypothetical protein
VTEIVPRLCRNVPHGSVSFREGPIARTRALTGKPQFSKAKRDTAP